MPTELIADPIVESSVIPSGMAINPLFDWAPILGIPLWVYISVVFILIIISVIIYWVLRMGKLASVKGWEESIKSMTQDDAMVWVISRIQKLTIECMTIKDNVLSSHDPLNISMWYVSSPAGVIRIGGMRGVVISEDFDRNRDIISEIALCYALDTFNRDLEILKEDVEQKYQQKLLGVSKEQRHEIEKPRVMKPVERFQSYADYGRACLGHLYPKGLDTPSYSQFSPNKFRKWFPTGNTSTHFGAENVMESRDMNIDRKERGFWDVHAMLAAAIVIGIIMIAAATFFPLG